MTTRLPSSRRTRPCLAYGLLGLLLALLPLAAWAQAPTWQAATSGNNFQPTSGTSVTRATAVDADGNVFVTGSFTGQVTFGNTRLVSAGGSDVFVGKWNAAASTWAGATSSGGTSNDVGYGLAVSGGSVYVTGQFFGSAAFGSTTLTSQGSNDVFVAKYTDAGGSLAPTWATRGGGTGNDIGYGLAVSGGSVYVGGTTGTGVASFGAAPGQLAPASAGVLAALDPATGTIQNLGVPLQGGTSTTRATATDAAGNVFVTGDFTGTVGFGSTVLVSAGGSDIFVAKWNAATSTWAGATSAGGTSPDIGYGLAVSGGSVYVTGYFGGSVAFGSTTLTSAGTNDLDVFVAKYTDAGTSLSAAAATSSGGPGNDVGYALAVSGGNVYVGGTTVPAATFGPFTLANPAGSTTNFLGQVLFTSPTLTSFSPGSGAAGSSFAAAGTNLNGATAVTFTSSGGAATNAPAGFVASANSITGIVVPAGLALGTYTVTVTTPNGTSNGLPFTVTAPAPTVTTITPDNGAVGTSVVITGTNFGGTTGVTFNGTTAPGFTVNAGGTQLTVNVPTGATSGPIAVTTPGGTATSASSFTVTQPTTTTLASAPTPRPWARASRSRPR
ncbi:MAG: beta strand repeat-containing protein [Janthinobacterium lividum]